jgi:uroporphyrinogen decarboxylase
MKETGYAALSREELRRVIEGRGNAGRPPVMLHFWIHPEAFSQPDAVRAILDKYPQDVNPIWFRIPSIYDAPGDAPSYRWSWKDAASKGGALDADGIVEDWDEELDAFLSDFPSADYPGLIPESPAEDGRYRLGCWWYFFFERFWSIRGMENALTDFYESPEAVHATFRKLTDFYKRMLERGKRELNLDGIFTSDDLGTQTSVFFSGKIFDEFFRPYYKEVVDKAHELGMHFWLHTCGNISEFLPKFIDIGIDVIHPIQKYAMDEGKVAREFGDKIAIWAGFDVQRTIPYGTPEEVRREARGIIDAYARPDGRFLFTLGNGATGDTPIPSLEALFDEVFAHGTRVIGRL